MSDNAPQTDWHEKFLEYAKGRGLLDPDVRPPLRHCPNGHELPDELKTTLGTTMWFQIQECPTCQKQDAKAHMMDRIIERLTKAGVPEMFQTWTTGSGTVNRSEREQLTVDDDNFQARLACSRHPERFWVMFSGSVGVGKTTWASALFCDLVDAAELPAGSSTRGARVCGLNGMWLSEADLFMRCDKEHHTSGYTARTEFLSKVCRSRLLLLDDLGGSRRNLTEWQGGAIRHLIDHRHKHKLPTFLTTNMPHWKHLATRYGDHVVSRMIDRCGSMTILTGGDRRL